jgi:uncharacterized Fe-S center protein
MIMIKSLVRTNNNAGTLVVVTVLAVAILVLGVGTTVINSATSVYASGKNDSNKSQKKVIAENKCADIGDNNRHIDIHDITCQIQNTNINCPRGSTCVIGKLDPWILSLPV